MREFGVPNGVIPALSSREWLFHDDDLETARRDDWCGVNNYVVYFHEQYRPSLHRDRVGKYNTGGS